MQIIESKLFTILLPDKGYKLINKNDGNCYQKIYLGVNDSADNYGEVVDDKYVNMEYVAELNDIKENVNVFKEQNDLTVDVLLLTIDEMYTSVEPLLAMMPMTLSEDAEIKISKFVLFYKMMVDRGLKNVEDVPERFRDML